VGKIHEIAIGGASVEHFRGIAADSALDEAKLQVERLSEQLSGRSIWNVNSTACGGGVAEMLQSFLSYVRGVGIDARWAVLSGPPAFFRLTKRLHNALHGSDLDDGGFGPADHELYERVARENADGVHALLRSGDFVILHDPQTAGLVPHLARCGARVIWRCHIGADEQNTWTKQAWSFLEPHLEEAGAFIFSREAYIPDFIDRRRAVIIPPAIDPFSPKNQPLPAATCRAILADVGLVEGPPGPGSPTFHRRDGSPGRVDRAADIQRLGRAPEWDRPLVVQVSRWDRLKDPVGVLRGFEHLLEDPPTPAPDLILAGPNVRAVSDDPEGAAVYDEVCEAWRTLSHVKRRRVHLASLPMADVDENAAIVNALQRHAAVVVQKSLREGFGLTVTEAMWKSRPILASATGGIRDQIDHGIHGLLLEDPSDIEAFSESLRVLLEQRETAEQLGKNAHMRVSERYLGIHSLTRYAKLLLSMLSRASS
jgi:trehalose synthase